MTALHNKACKHCCIITPQNMIFNYDSFGMEWQLAVPCECELMQREVHLLLLHWVKKQCQNYKSFHRRANPATHDFISYPSNHQIQQQSFFFFSLLEITSTYTETRSTVDSSGILNMNRTQIGVLLLLSNKGTNSMFFRKGIIKNVW